jgi:nucleotide-binding universal stress UspA family protein
VLSSQAVSVLLFEHLIVPLDGSSFSESVVLVAVRVAKAMKSELTLLHVVEPERHLSKPPPKEHLLSGAHRAALESFKGAAQNAASFYLEIQARAARERGVRVICNVSFGRPSQMISRAAEELAGSAVVMATHTRPDGLGAPLGSVADEVLRIAHSPVLLVRPDRDPRAPVQDFREIVVPLDGSPQAERPLLDVAALAKGLELPVHLVHAVERPAQSYLGGPIGVQPSSLVESQEEAADAYLRSIANRLSELVVTHRLLHGEAAAATLEYADGMAGSIIALTARVDAQHERLGRVAYRIIQSSRCPVLVFPRAVAVAERPQWRVEDTNA